MDQQLYDAINRRITEALFSVDHDTTLKAAKSLAHEATMTTLTEVATAVRRLVVHDLSAGGGIDGIYLSRESVLFLLGQRP